MFSKAKTESDASVKASYVVLEFIVQSSKPFSEGAFVKDRWPNIDHRERH